MANDKVTVFVTRWALTEGIVELQIDKEESTGMIVRDIQHKDIGWKVDCINRWEYFDSREDALIRAKSMRINKINSLKRQLSILQALTFD